MSKGFCKSVNNFQKAPSLENAPPSWMKTPWKWHNAVPLCSASIYSNICQNLLQMLGIWGRGQWLKCQGQVIQSPLLWSVKNSVMIAIDLAITALFCLPRCHENQAKVISTSRWWWDDSIILKRKGHTTIAQQFLEEREGSVASLITLCGLLRYLCSVAQKPLV